MFNCASVYEEEARSDPDAEGEGGTQFGEHPIGADVLAEGGDVFDGIEAALGSAVRGRKDG